MRRTYRPGEQHATDSDSSRNLSSVQCHIIDRGNVYRGSNEDRGGGYIELGRRFDGSRPIAGRVSWSCLRRSTVGDERND